METNGTLEGWLQNLSLEQYLSTFQNAGFTSLEHCTSLDDDLLNIIGITPLGHRKRILSHLPVIKEGEYDFPKTPLALQNDLTTESSPSCNLNTSENNGDGSDRPRPVPKPRKTKRIKNTSESEPSDSSPRPVPAPRVVSSKNSQGSINLKGVTIDESTDELDDDHVYQEIGPNEPQNVAEPRLTFVPEPTGKSILIQQKLQQEFDSFFKDTTTNVPEAHDKGISISDTVPPPRQPKTDMAALSNPAYCGEEQVMDDENLYESIWVGGASKKTNSPKPVPFSPVKETDIDADIEDNLSPPPKLPAKQKTLSAKRGFIKETNIDEFAQGDQIRKTSPTPPHLPEKETLKSSNIQSSVKQTDIDNMWPGTGNSNSNEKTTDSWTENQLYVNEPVKTRSTVSNNQSRVTSNLIQFSPDTDNELFSFDRTSKGSLLAPDKPLKPDTIQEQDEPGSAKTDPFLDQTSAAGTFNFSDSKFGNFPGTNTGFQISDEDFAAMIRNPDTIQENSLDTLSVDKAKDGRKSFDMPPPEFPPPPLPTEPSADINLSLDDSFSAFDPLKSEPINTLPTVPVNSTSPFPVNTIPPVPPRAGSVSSSSDTTYVNLGTSKPGTEPSIDESTNQDKTQGDLYSAVGASAKERFKVSETSFNTSIDPFHGDDPFSEFATECEQFNQGGMGSSVSMTTFEDDSPGYQDFDPFGLNRNDSTRSAASDTPSSLNLNDVPPPPHWNESIHDPGSLYAMAKGMQLDACSTDDSSDLDSEDPLDSSPEVLTVGSDIVPSVISPRSRERSGYLYKQGGVKGNKGWRKRWVIFNGRDIRYYANAKSQVSKRIVPLSCMIRVDVNVKGSDTSRFKFQLVTKHRVFMFAAETLDDCTMWSSTLMEAILNYNPPPGGEREGGDMYDPDKQGYVKFERKKDKYYVAIKQGKLCYYNNEQDYKQASPIHEIEMKLASVKEVSKNRLQMSTHYAYFILVFDSYHDCLLWRMAIEEAIADGLGDNRVLNEVQKNTSNLICADCDTKDPHWASINLGIVLCKKCAGIHRHFDVRLSRVKSLRMDTAIWTPSLIEMMKAIGNDSAKSFWEGTLRDKITESTPPAMRKQFLENKYKQKAFCHSHSLTGNQKALDEQLLMIAETDDLYQTMQLVFSGANVLYTRPSDPEAETAFQIAKRSGQRLQMEFLYQNGGDKNSRGYADSEEVLALRLRSEVCLEGFLMKTGSNMKDFLKRWCILEHGCIRYFTSEKSSIAKDSIEHESIQCIHATPLDRTVSTVSNISRKISFRNPSRNTIRNHGYSPKMDIPRYPHAFELSTVKKGNRCYLFAASSAEEKQTWFRAISKLFCPIPLFEEVGHLDFCLAGNFYVREGLTSEWRKTWLMINNKVVQYTDKDIKLTEQIDLRKVMNLKYQDAVSACTYCSESGRCFAVDIPGKALYFQANLERDTVKLFTELEKGIKSGGDLLVDQQLTAEDIPVIVDKCIRFIEDYGLRERGIYREAAVNSKVQGILNKLTSDAYSLVLQREIHTVHEVANVLKRYLRNLKEPLLTSSLYDQWLQHSGNDHDTKLKWYKYLISQLPDIHRYTLKLLAGHLSRISKYSDENLMTTENIAIAFGSTLMKASETQLQQGNIPLEMKVIGDIVQYHEWLFDVPVENKDEEIERNIEEAKKKMEMLQRNTIKQNMASQGNLIISIYYLDYRGQSEIQQVTSTTDVRSTINLIKKRLGIKSGTWSLHEVVCKGLIERPLHPSDNIYNIAMAWAGWEDPYRSSVCLCLKPDDLIQKIDSAYEFGRPLFADLKYSEKKTFKKFTFEFKQSRLSYSKDMKSAGTPINCWNIEDLNIYVGTDPKRTCPTKHCFSFVAKGEKIGKDTPFFGRTVCCNTEDELMSWVAAMMVAQHPEGLLS